MFLKTFNTKLIDNCSSKGAPSPRIKISLFTLSEDMYKLQHLIKTFCKNRPRVSSFKLWHCSNTFHPPATTCTSSHPGNIVPSSKGRPTRRKTLPTTRPLSKPSSTSPSTPRSRQIRVHDPSSRIPGSLHDAAAPVPNQH